VIICYALIWVAAFSEKGGEEEHELE
jgi:hypothetical protein